jgi:hypothetical protein
MEGRNASDVWWGNEKLGRLGHRCEVKAGTNWEVCGLIKCGSGEVQMLSCGGGLFEVLWGVAG